MKLVHHVSLWTKFIDTHWLTVQSVSCFQSSAISNNRLVHHFKTVKYIIMLRQGWAAESELNSKF